MAVQHLEKKRANAVTSTMMATDLADYLVRKRVTFREAHGAVGSLVRQAEEQSVELTGLPFSAFQKAHPQFERDVLEELTAEKSIAHREIVGGTGGHAVRAQMEAAKRTLGF